MAEAAFGEREDLGRRYGEHDGVASFVMEPAVAYLVSPTPVPFGGPRRCNTSEHVIVGDLDGVAFYHDIQPGVPVVAAGGQDHVRVAAQVGGLLLALTGGEMNDPVKPHGNQRRDVRPTIGPDRRDPEQLGRFEYVTGLVHSVATAPGR